ncbi:MAG: hypothetical protein HY700_12765 [Gemmatimonadetes bacterium]|nr:hypothetical protein [Gemmatimonadota bacterium]
MKRMIPFLAAVVLAVACGESTDPTLLGSLGAAFQSVPLGFDNAQHSFAGAADGFNPEWGPHGDGMMGGMMGSRGPGGDHRGGPGRDGGPGFGGFMGGGLGDLFIGGGFGLGFGHGRGDPSLIGVCSYSASTGRITCDPVTARGLTITRSAAYSDINDAFQSAFDSATTNTINVQVTVTGTRIHRDGDTSVVNAASDRTVTGLLASERTINGTSRANENISGTDSTGHFTAVRVAGDTTNGVKIPAPSATNAHPYPTAGTVTRSMQVTVTRDGQSPVNKNRREVVTYDGSDTAKVVITQDGVTKNCTLPLPRGRITCQ